MSLANQAEKMVHTLNESSESINGNEPVVHTSTVCMSILGNPPSFEAMGPYSAKCGIDENAATNVFNAHKDTEATKVLAKMKRAMITGVHVLETHTNIPDVFQLNIDNLHGNEYSSNGNKGSMFILGPGHNTIPNTVYKMSGDHKLGLQWMNMYPQYTAHNLKEVINSFF